MDKKLSKIYYSTEGYWKGIATISKLAKAGGVDENDARKWLEKQVLWQIYLSPPGYIPRQQQQQYHLFVPYIENNCLQ